MNSLFSNIIPTFLLLLTGNIYCQEIRQDDIINIAEELAQDDTDPEAAVIFLEQLHELTENPVRINSADESELSRLFFLSVFQIKSIADHVKSTGSILSVYEIASIPGFNRHTAEIMTPFITLEKNLNRPDELTRLRNRLITNLIFKPGESDSSYPGSALKILTKYKAESGPFSAGLTIEKDAGEKLFSVSPPLPDFLSGYVAFSGNGFVRKLIAGDFSARFGQGLSVNTGIHTGIPLTSTGYNLSRNEIKPYTSTDENNFFRGAATELVTGKMKLIVLFSYNNIDATINTFDDSSAFFIENFYRAGLHNAASLMTKKDAVAEMFYGADLNINLRSFTFGINWSETRLSVPVRAVSVDPEDLYEFQGRSNSILSAYYTGSPGKSLLFGEISTDLSGNSALVQGFAFRPSDRLSINCLLRRYSPGYNSLHGRGPGNNSLTGNEEGILCNFTFEAASHLFISAGYDFCRYPWLKYRTSFPSLAKKYEIKLRYLPARIINLEVSCNRKYSIVDKQTERGIAAGKETDATTIKTVTRFTLNDKLSLNTRIDYKWIRQSGSRGMIMAQDLAYRFARIPVTLWTRYCIYNTDDWDSRIYLYENDLLYSFSIPAFSGNGTRSYIMAKWDIGDIAELRVKYGLTSRSGTIDPKSNNDDLKVQFRIWF